MLLLAFTLSMVWARGEDEAASHFAAWELIDGVAVSGAGQIDVAERNWDSPRFAVEPFSYHVIRFDAAASEQASWGVFFEGEDGELMNFDIHDSIEPTGGEWREEYTVVRVHANARRLFLRFHKNPAGLRLRDFRIAAVSRDEARLHADAIASLSPFVRYAPPRDRWQYLPRTERRLMQGGPLRIVMLGDSICNDISNGLFELHLTDAWPASHIEVVDSVRGSGGCPWYQHENRVEEYALRHAPDLIVIAGISHGNDPEAIRSVVRQIRAHSASEILVLNGVGAQHEVLHENAFRYADMGQRQNPDNPAELRQRIAETVRANEAFPHRLRTMCDQEEVAFLDIRSAWDAYIQASWRPQAWFMRDSVHANRHGKQVAARLLYRHLTPEPAAMGIVAAD